MSIGLSLGMSLGQSGAASSGPSLVAVSVSSLYTVTTSAIANMPATIPAGDVLIAFLGYTGSDVAITPPAGWTLIQETPASTFRKLTSFWRIADGSEGASATWTLGSAQNGQGVVLAYRGANATTPVEASGEATSTAVSLDAPSLVSGGANRRLIAAYLRNTGGTITLPAGMEQRYDVSNASVRMVICDLRVGAGATGAKTFTSGASATGAAHAVLVQP